MYVNFCVTITDLEACLDLVVVVVVMVMMMMMMMSLLFLLLLMTIMSMIVEEYLGCTCY